MDLVRCSCERTGRFVRSPLVWTIQVTQEQQDPGHSSTARPTSCGGSWDLTKQTNASREKRNGRLGEMFVWIRLEQSELYDRCSVACHCVLFRKISHVDWTSTNGLEWRSERNGLPTKLRLHPERLKGSGLGDTSSQAFPCHGKRC